MTKREVNRILKAGTAKERALLIAENEARMKYGQERLLSGTDLFTLQDSFQTKKELDLLEHFKNYGYTVTMATVNLQGLLYESKMHQSNLRGYILVRSYMETAELLTNSILHEIPEEERKRIANTNFRRLGVHFPFFQVTPDPEGYIDLKASFDSQKPKAKRGAGDTSKDRDFSLMDLTLGVKQDLINCLTRFFSWEKAILDFMDEKGFKVKAYRESILAISERAKTQIIGWEKYEGTSKSANDREKKLLEQYAVCPDISEIQVNEEEYKWFKKHILGDD